MGGVHERTCTGVVIDSRKVHNPVLGERNCCHHVRVHWMVTLTGRSRDVDRVLAAGVEGVVAADDPSDIVLDVTDPEYDDFTDAARESGRSLIEAAVRHINGACRLRWGRVFEGFTVKSVTYNDDQGNSGGMVLFTKPAYDHMLPTEFADMVERLGYPRPEPPTGVGDVEALDLTAVVALAAVEPDVGRVLRLLEMMLEGDDAIDWAAGYSVLELIEQHAYRCGASGQALGWWTRGEFDRFTHMANSFEAVGISSRHPGRRYRPPANPMSSMEAAWLVRRVAARWIVWLLGDGFLDEPGDLGN